MPIAKKLPSGSWRCQVHAGYETGPDGKMKQIRKSFTVKDPSRAGKKECERLAAEWMVERKYASTPGNTSVMDVISKYLSLKGKVLSPSTISAYRRYLPCFDDIRAYRAALDDRNQIEQARLHKHFEEAFVGV